MNHKHRIRYLTRASLIAAMYVTLTLLSNSFGLAFGPIQVRISEALCILAVFLPEAVPGLTVGCVIANLFSPFGAGMIGDMIFGSFATLIGAWGAYKLSAHPYLAPIPTVLSNTIIVSFVLAIFYQVEESVPFLMLTVGIGEVIAAYLLGIALYHAMTPLRAHILKEDREKPNGV